RGQVLVAVDVAGETARPARIRGVDTGVGIPEERLGAIFDAFEQAESSTARKYGGTGLALPISKALCELLGYTLAANSRVGSGTELSMELTADGAAAEGVEEAAVTVGGIETEPGRERRALIAVDEADSRVLLTHYVGEFGCRAIATHSAAS